MVEPVLVVSFREAYWSGDPSGLDDLHSEGERMRTLAELCIADPLDVEGGSPDIADALVSTQADYARRLEFTRLIHCERLSNSQWKCIKACYGNRCAYCGVVQRLYREHVIPLMSGGRDNWSNVVPSCRRCNSSKHVKSLDNWCASREDGDRIMRRYIEGTIRRDALLGNANATM